MAQVSIARLFDDNRDKLKLEWIAGKGGGTRELRSEFLRDSARGLIGHLNFIHPNLIQVLGASEIEYLEGLQAESCRSILAQACARDLACFIVAGVERVEATMNVANGDETIGTHVG